MAEETRIMLQVGVEGDLFDPHEENEWCPAAGCKPEGDRYRAGQRV